MTFLGRTREKKTLTQFYEHTGMNTALIYGRRRVGKSELIKQTLKECGTRSIYYECKQTSEQNNAGSLAALIAENFGYPPLSFSGIEETLNFLFQKAQDEKLILVLDEYPYLREGVRGLDSIVKSLIDEYREKSQLKLILCGSFVDTMKSLLLSENALYGRIDLTLNLKPMDYYDSALFYPGFSDEDKVRLYSVFGGIPHYNRLIDQQLSVRENIISLIASVGARLENEVSMYLRSEIARIANANEVFEALAQGFSRYSDILSQSHVSSSPALADVLDRLIRMEVVAKEAPINDEHSRRKSGYFISDNLSLFYYRYVFRYASQMNVMEPETFFDRYIAPDFENEYVPGRFEDVCRQYLIRQNRAGRITPPFERIGKYWYDLPKEHRNGEFDIVTQDENGYTFYEAKFRKTPVTEAMIAAEIEQVKAAGLNCRRYGFFSRSGFEQPKSSDEVVKIELSELYR